LGVLSESLVRQTKPALRLNCLQTAKLKSADCIVVKVQADIQAF
jgi:hypothetical protein